MIDSINGQEPFKGSISVEATLLDANMGEEGKKVFLSIAVETEKFQDKEVMLGKDVVHGKKAVIVSSSDIDYECSFVARKTRSCVGNRFRHEIVLKILNEKTGKKTKKQNKTSDELVFM